MYCQQFFHIGPGSAFFEVTGPGSGSGSSSSSVAASSQQQFQSAKQQLETLQERNAAEESRRIQQAEQRREPNLWI